MNIVVLTASNMERYRSGHNEAVLKTVCPKGRVGSNPTLSVLEISSGARVQIPPSPFGVIHYDYWISPVVFLSPDELL